MKCLMILAALSALAGCAVVPAAPAYYSTAVVQDPHQWHTVSAEPVGAPGQYAAPVQAAPAYTTEQVYAAPVYAAPPVYVAAPYYAPAPYYYPPVSIGLDFAIGGWCCHRGGWGRGYHHR